jgi:hypothetical protein
MGWYDALEMWTENLHHWVEVTCPVVPTHWCVGMQGYTHPHTLRNFLTRYILKVVK